MANDLSDDPFAPFLEERPPSTRRRLLAGGIAVLVAVALLVQMWPTGSGDPGHTAAAAGPDEVTILAGAPASLGAMAATATAPAPLPRSALPPSR